MEKLLEKISEYHILNCIVPGWCFCWFCNTYLGIQLLNENILTDILTIFTVGLISNRIGSAFAKLILEKFSCFKNDRNKYNKAKEKNEFVSKLSSIRNMYRTFLGMIILYGFSSLSCYLIKKYEVCSKILSFVVPILLFVLFLFSYYTQSEYIRRDIEDSIES